MINDYLCLTDMFADGAIKNVLNGTIPFVRSRHWK